VGEVGSRPGEGAIGSINMGFCKIAYRRKWLQRGVFRAGFGDWSGPDPDTKEGREPR